MFNVHFERYFSHHEHTVHDMINFLYYEHWTNKRKYFYVYLHTPFTRDWFDDCLWKIKQDPLKKLNKIEISVIDLNKNKQSWFNFIFFYYDWQDSWPIFEVAESNIRLTESMKSFVKGSKFQGWNPS